MRQRVPREDFPKIRDFTNWIKTMSGECIVNENDPGNKTSLDSSSNMSVSSIERFLLRAIEVKELSEILEKYRQYEKLFVVEFEIGLSEYSKWDYEIFLKEGFESRFYSIYPQD